MDLNLGIVLGFLLGGVLFGVITWQITERRLKVKYEQRLAHSQAEHEQELGRSKAESEQELADDAKSIWHFLQHELKQPVGTALLALDRLKPNVTNGKGQDIIKELERQLHLFSDLTEACRTYAEFFKFGTAHTQIVSVGKVLQEVKQAIWDYNPECKIELYIRDLTGPLNVNANPDQMRVIFRNLLDNAWNYSTRENPIRVDASSAQGQVVVDVTNDGKGMANEIMGEIMKNGGRGVDSNNPGSGLGLYYTNRIVKANGGTLIHEKQPGGQLMRVILPAATKVEPDITALALEPASMIRD
jgi:signal transduction histidine kinase